MARRKKQTDIEDAIEHKTRQSNGFDKAKTRSYVDRIENLHADIASRMAEALNECRTIHEDIKIVYQEAKDEGGIPKKALKQVIKARRLERKATEVRENLDVEDQDNFDLIRHALGDLADTPLGRAVLGDDAKDVRPEFLQEAERSEANGAG